MKVRFLYHTAKGEFKLWPPRVIGSVIIGWTWMLGCFYNWKVLKYNYSHEEIWIPDEYGQFQDPETGEYVGQCISSTTRGKYNGVRIAPASEVLTHPERWDYIECDINELSVRTAVRIIRECFVGRKYDYVAVLLGFTTPFHFNSPKRWYCSEICAWFKHYCGPLTEKLIHIISPRRSAYLTAKKFHEPLPLIGGVT